MQTLHPAGNASKFDKNYSRRLSKADYLGRTGCVSLVLGEFLLIPFVHGTDIASLFVGWKLPLVVLLAVMDMI